MRYATRKKKKKKRRYYFTLTPLQAAVKLNPNIRLEATHIHEIHTFPLFIYYTY